MDTIGDRSQNKNSRSQDFSLPSLLAGEAWGAKNPYEKWDRGDAGERDGIRKVHAMARPRLWCPSTRLSSTSETKAT
jgi:hypothetical protein